MSCSPSSTDLDVDVPPAELEDAEPHDPAAELRHHRVAVPGVDLPGQVRQRPCRLEAEPLDGDHPVEVRRLHLSDLHKDPRVTPCPAPRLRPISTWMCRLRSSKTQNPTTRPQNSATTAWRFQGLISRARSASDHAGSKQSRSMATTRSKSAGCILRTFTKIFVSPIVVLLVFDRSRRGCAACGARRRRTPRPGRRTPPPPRGGSRG